MAQDNLTPEERLLKIIENPKTILKSKLQPGFAKEKIVGLDSLTLWLKKIFYIDKNEELRGITLHTVNKIYILLCAFITLFVFFDFFKINFSLKDRIKNITAGVPAPVTEKKNIFTLDASVTDVLAESKKHNIFTFLPPKTIIETTKKAVDITQIIANLKLVGIIWSNNPQAMIEDTKEKKTYLLSAGEQIGEVTLKKILRDKVVIGKEEQELELR